MKVLFVYSGTYYNGNSPIVTNQAQSLIDIGCDVEMYPILEGGIRGYIKYFFKLKKQLKQHKYDVIHAHYALCGILARISSKSVPVICSLMGSDLYKSKKMRFFVRLFSHHLWDLTIVKSEDMKITLRNDVAMTIPNGVDFKRFRSIDMRIAQKRLGWNPDKRHILFGANPKRSVKNFDLARKSVQMLNDSSIELHWLEDVPNSEMPIYLNASDVILLTSKWEGSPNVIKEALACSRPIVAADVGDVAELIQDVENSILVTTYNSEDFASALKLALGGKTTTNGKEHILHLESSAVARELFRLYQRLNK